MSLLDHLLLGAKVDGSGSRAHAEGRRYALRPAVRDVFAMAAAEGGGQQSWARSRTTVTLGRIYTFIAGAN